MATPRRLLALPVVVVAVLAATATGQNTFPDGFLLGTSTAAFQIEGAWNESGKGENIWDHITHSNPDYIAQRHNADVACDSYHKFREDIQLVKDMGMDLYRFSLSWSRLLPSGGLENPNPDGLRFYNAVVDECVRKGIKPVVTLYHWDLPQALQDIGGWPNEHLVDFFADYAEYAFRNFGDRVKSWITFNEPVVTCADGYGTGEMAPGIKSDRRGDLMCGHTVLKAHARAYRLYQDKYKGRQRGSVGISLSSNHFEPKDPGSLADMEAAETLQQLVLGWFAHPIFSSKGDYPPVLKEKFASARASEGLNRSRLPRFTEADVHEIRGSADFFGLNTYTTKLISTNPGGFLPHMSDDPSWKSSSAPWLKVVPWGLRKILQWVCRQYNNPPLYVTESGFADDGQLHDLGRVDYYQDYVTEMLSVIHQDRCDIRGYVAWSLLDNFEWTSGYTQKFGLVKVDFDDPQRTRTPKLSAKYWKWITSSQPRRLPTQEELDRLRDGERAAPHQEL